MLEKVKDRLKITWDDEDGTIQDIIEDGKYNLNDLTGVELDFEQNNLARSLLFEYCRYAYNNAADLFEENFQKEIMRLQLNCGVEQMKEDEEEDDTDD